MANPPVTIDEPEPDIRGLSHLSIDNSNGRPVIAHDLPTPFAQHQIDPADLDEKTEHVNVYEHADLSQPNLQRHDFATHDANVKRVPEGGNNPNASVDTLEPHHGDDGEAAMKWEDPTYWQSFKNMMRGVPILWITPALVPVAWGLHFSHQNPVAVFVVSLLAIVPLAGGLGFATEELAIRCGDTWGGLLNATFGNAVELLVAILALVKGDIDIVQASMAGSILSNILLVLGMSYFAGGLRFHEQVYGVVGAQTMISLLGLSVFAILLPEAYHLAWPSTSTARSSAQSAEIPPEQMKIILAMSRGLSFILLACYAAYLLFTLWTHAYLFKQRDEVAVHSLPTPSHQRVFPRPQWVPSLHTVISRDTDNKSQASSDDSHMQTLSVPTVELNGLAQPAGAHRNSGSSSPGVQSPSILANSQQTPPELDIGRPRAYSSASATRTSPSLRFRETTHPLSTATTIDTLDIEAQHHRVEAGLPENPRTKAIFAFGMLITFTGLAGLTAECLVDSIDGLTESTNVSREFVGLILLPVIGNAVEHITAVTVSLKDRLNLSMSIAVGSSIQVSLGILPLLVLIGWMIGQPMSLLFDTYETIVLVIAIILVNFAIADGRSQYLEGFVLMMAYVCIALVTWFYDPIH